MVSVDLGACEWFVWDLRRSNLVERGQLEQLVSEFLERSPKAEPSQLAQYLVQKKILTPFQSESLLAGKNQGLVLGPFTLLDALGAGSMGTVYHARSKNHPQQAYAVKVLPRRSMWNIRMARRKVREFEQFQHPAVVPFVDVGTAGGMHYLAWPLVEGETLDKLVAREGKLPPSLAAYFALQTAEGLEACHARDIIHGLIKPSNLLIAADRQVKILDFGVGSLLTETEGESVVDTMSTANTLASGLDCASPESIMDPTLISAASDQYSLGCVLYFCLTGEYPFAGGSAVEKMMAHQTKQPRAITEAAPETPAELVVLVEKMMAKTPAQRYASISDVVMALRPLARDSVILPPGRMPWLKPSSSPETPVPMATPVPPAKSQTAAPSRIAPAQVDAVSAEAPPQPAVPPAAPTPARTPVKPHNLPSRRTFQPPGVSPRPRLANSSAPAPAEPVAHAPEPNGATPPTALAPPAAPAYQNQLNWEDRIGPGGIVLLALASCAAAWLVMWLLNR